jgi:hypothetical protein
MKNCHSFGRNAIPAFLVLLLIGTTLGCPPVPIMRQDDPVLVSIAITTQPAKTECVQDEPLDITGIVVTGTYSDGTTKTETVNLSNISGYNPDNVITQTLTVTVSGNKTATFPVTVTAPVLQSITITSPLVKTVCFQGDVLDINGLVVKGAYSDGNTWTVAVGLTNISGTNLESGTSKLTAVGTQTLTVTVSGKTATYTVTVNAPVLQSITITNPPTKTVYIKGEALEIAGLVVTGTYSDGAKQSVTVNLSNISGYNANNLGQQTLTGTVSGNKTATFPVTVNAPVLQSIAVTSPLVKTVYFQGDVLDINGLVVKGDYSDGNTWTVAVGLSNISGTNLESGTYKLTAVGTQTLTITVDGKTAAFTVTVTAAALQSIAVTGTYKTVYTKGEALDINGLVVTGYYSNGTARTETVSLSNISGYNANTVGTQTLTVTVGGKTAAFTVTVLASAAFTVKLEDPINGIPAGIVLSKTASGAPMSAELTISGVYSSYHWFLNDNPDQISIRQTRTLTAADCRLGTNVLTVVATTPDGVTYSREITFTVNQ